MQWFGKKVTFSRFLGQVDQDDATNLPIGLATICRNVEFTRDTGGPTCATTRAGVNLTMQTGKDYPITGLEEFVFQPELPTDVSFQRPLVFDLGGTLYYENPVGGGKLVPFPAGVLIPPANAWMQGAIAANKLFGGFANFGQNGAATAASQPACIDPKALTVNPLGMKPFGWTWQPNTQVIVGEMCTPPTPSTGNGHTYRCIQAGKTGANPPFAAGAWPTNEATQFNDGTARWQELTMVVANRLPPPVAATLALAAGGGWADGLDIYVVITLVNAQGETLASVAAFATTGSGNDTVRVTVPTLASMAGWIRGLPGQYVPTGANVYVASVGHGGSPPALADYALANVGPVALGATFNSTGPGTAGGQPPGVCTARVTPGQLPTPDDQVEIQRVPNAGAFPAGRDVYVAQTYTNNVGETKLGPVNSIINTNADDAVQATVAVPEDENGNALFQINSVGIYEADVPTGSPAPAASQFQLVGYYVVPEAPIITSAAQGQNPPASNGTGPGGAIAADKATGGINGTQGYRYAAAMFMNQNETVSGFTLASVQKVAIDQDGWEVGVFNVAVGPANVVGRPVAFTVADGSNAGPFNWIGVVDLLAPSQNFVYPAKVPSGEDNISATIFLDNVTTTGIFNFTDSFDQSANDVTDRLRVMAVPPCCRVDYLESASVLVLTGVNGTNGGGVVSIPGDLESFYGDTGPLPIVANGETCYGFTDVFKGIVFALRSGSGYEIPVNSGDPSSWGPPRRRWGNKGTGKGKGPCGFKAWDACGKFIAFIHKTGLYKYDQEDDTMTKEVPRDWATINWAACAAFECFIDEDTKQVLCSVAVNGSAINNKVIALSYEEGWQNPIHFSTFSGKEISMDAARRWSFQDVAANVIRRVTRTLPPGPLINQGPDWTTQTDTSFGVNQLLFGSSAADGTVHARTPGIFSDNGSGIDMQYRTMCAGWMMSPSKPEGFNLNASGSGVITAAFIASRDMSDGADGKTRTFRVRDIALTPDQKIGITRKVSPMCPINEYWSVEFTNGKTKDAWVSLKAMDVYGIPFTGGRDVGDR